MGAEGCAVPFRRMLLTCFILPLLLSLLLTACGRRAAPPTGQPPRAGAAPAPAVQAPGAPPAAAPAAAPAGQVPAAPAAAPAAPGGGAAEGGSASSDTAQAEAGDRPVILALGDSLTVGYGVPAAESYPARLQAALDARGLRYRVINAGVSGDTTAGGLQRLDRLLAIYRPRVVIVELGANDGLRGLPLDQVRRNLAAIIERCQAAGAQVVLAGMMLPPNYGEAYTRPFAALFPELARQYGIALIPFFLEGVAGRPDLNQPDGIHPTGAGYAIVTENVLRVLLPLLQEAGGPRP